MAKTFKINPFLSSPYISKAMEVYSCKLKRKWGEGGGGVKEVVNIVNNIVDHKLSKI